MTKIQPWPGSAFHAPEAVSPEECALAATFVVVASVVAIPRLGEGAAWILAFVN